LGPYGNPLVRGWFGLDAWHQEGFANDEGQIT
jgi:hypothetical protein